MLVAVETLIGLSIITWLAALLMAGFAVASGIRVRQIAFGWCLNLYSRKIAGTTVRLGLLPWNGSVQFSDNRYEELADDKQRCFDSKPIAVRFLIPFTGCVILFVPGLIFWGGDIAKFFPRAIPQFFLGVVSPLSDAQVYLGQYYALVGEVGFLKGFSALLAKLGVLALLPISPVFGLGQALFAASKLKFEGMVNAIAVVGALLLVAAQISWGTALFYFVLNS